MSSHKPNVFKLTEGVDAYNPAISQAELKFYILSNVEPALGRLLASRGGVPLWDLNGERILDFGYYQLPNRQFANLYAFTKTSVYWFNFETEEFLLTPIYDEFPNTLHPFVILPWYGCLYVTKFGGAYVKLERKIATVVADAPSARYGVVANSHAFLAGVAELTTSHLARSRWSDLENLEDFVVDTAISEADFFDLEADARQITGCSYQRGVPVIYAENAIWTASPVGIPGGFRFDPLFPGLGNIFHSAVVRNKETDFFIGQDNIYQLNGLQVVPIGNQIFERFIADVDVSDDTIVRGFADSRRNQIFWIYNRSAGGKWSIVYNYLEQKWSERDPQDVSAFFDSPRTTLRGYETIDEVTDTIHEHGEAIDASTAGFPVTFKPLVGSTYAGQFTGEIARFDSTAFRCKVETFDLFFKDFAEVNEVTRVNIDYVGSGQPNLTVEIGVRNNQSEAISWSEQKTVAVQNGVLSFFCRNEGVGRYVRFRFVWDNEPADYIMELLLVSFVTVEDENGNPAK